MTTLRRTYSESVRELAVRAGETDQWRDSDARVFRQMRRSSKFECRMTNGMQGAEGEGEERGYQNLKPETCQRPLSCVTTTASMA